MSVEPAINLQYLTSAIRVVISCQIIYFFKFIFSAIANVYEDSSRFSFSPCKIEFFGKKIPKVFNWASFLIIISCQP